MRILVTTIPFSGTEISSTISRDALNVRMKSGSHGSVIEFIKDPIVSLRLTRTHGGVLVTGTISSVCDQDCARCADLKAHTVSAKLDWVLQTDSDRAGPNDAIDDPGVIFYSGEHVDLEEHLQEALILALSPFWKPALTSAGTCSACDKNCLKPQHDANPGSQAGTPQQPKRTLESLLQSALENPSSHGKRTGR
jgi:uncharacterized metal-binding protein YceD (DUF177 family)